MRQFDYEFGAMSREDVVTDEYRSTLEVTGDPTAAKDRRSGRDIEQFRIPSGGGRGPDRLGRRRQRDRQVLVERSLFDLGDPETGRQLLRTPDGDDGERLLVGPVDPSNPQHPVDTQDHLDLRWCVDDLEVEDLPSGPAPFGFELGFDRAEMGEPLSQRFLGYEPADTLPGRDESVLAQRLERLAHRHPRRAVLRGQRRLGR